MWKNFGLPVTDEAEIGSKLVDGRKMARFDVLGGSIGIMCTREGEGFAR